MSESDKRLYGLPDVEYLKADPCEVIEEWLTDNDRVTEPFIIEEWSTYPPRYHLPTSERLYEWLDEWVCEMGEAGEFMDLPKADEETVAAMEALLDLVAGKIRWSMARNKLRELLVTPSDDPQNPLIDGMPAWGPSQS